MKRPKNSAYTKIGNIQIYVHDIIDDKQEYERMKKLELKLNKQISKTEAKLYNENFLTKAKKEVIDVERNNLENLLLAGIDLLKNMIEIKKSLNEIKGQ